MLASSPNIKTENQKKSVTYTLPKIVEDRTWLGTIINYIPDSLGRHKTWNSKPVHYSQVVDVFTIISYICNVTSPLNIQQER